ncbi:MAG: redoxin domain-containing protein [Pyrinomonadaceae bacterium]|nr:redoxin domain-containing protein [Blastocatellia bacterium]
MKILFALIILSLGFILVSAQNEQAPVVEKEFAYKDWVYKNVKTGTDMNLRKFSFGKKLVMVVYFAPWCPNWKHDAAFVQGLYEKYKGNGFDVIGVGEYDPVDVMKTHLDAYKITFPAVYESELRTDKQKTLHYEYRKAAGDTRNWGSPWYVFLEPEKLEKSGIILSKKANVVNGELIKDQAESFIRTKLGLAL